MNEWIEDLSDLVAAGVDAVLVTVAAIRGSAPREAGAKMIVTATETVGTIGGGQLEYQCARIAVGMLGGDAPILRRFPLGAAMGQCCGGVVDVLFEPVDALLPGWLSDLSALHGQRCPAVLVSATRAPAAKHVVTADAIFAPGDARLPAGVIARARSMAAGKATAEICDGCLLEAIVGTDFNIAVFGAGHVGVEVVAALSKLDANLRWIDSRRNVFRSVPRNVRAVETGEPPLEVAAMPPGSYYLVMTHSHALDYEICVRILNRRDAAYCGLIGSRSKRRRFEKRFRAQGLSEAQLGELVCPIGIGGIDGKKPAEIAIAAAAELLQARSRAAAAVRGDLPDNVRPLR